MVLEVRTLDNRWTKAKKKAIKTPVIVGLDLGTQGIEATAVNALTLEMVPNGKAEHGFSTFEIEGIPGRKSQNPLHWRDALHAVIGKLISQGAFENGEIIAVGISGQMHALVMLDANNMPLDLACLWNCNSAIEFGRLLTAQFGQKVDGRLTISHLVKELKIRPEWFRNNVDRWTTPAGYLGILLTGKNVVGIGEASGTGLLALNSAELCQERLDFLQALYGKVGFEELCPSFEHQDRLSLTLSEGAKYWLGISSFCADEVVIAAPEGDQPALCIGNGVLRPGQAALNVGTSIVIDFLSNKRPNDGSITIDFFFDGVGNMLNMGLAANGLQVTDRVAKEYAAANCNGDLNQARKELDAQAAGLPPATGLFIDFGSAEPFLGVDSPLQTGVNWSDNPSWGQRWANAQNLTGILLRLRLQSLAAGGAKPTELVAGGDAGRDTALMQTWANSLQVPIRVPQLPMGACTLGAIRLAALAEEKRNGDGEANSGEFLGALSLPSSGDRIYRPDPSQDGHYAGLTQMLADAVAT